MYLSTPRVNAPPPLQHFHSIEIMIHIVMIHIRSLAPSFGQPVARIDINCILDELLMQKRPKGLPRETYENSGADVYDELRTDNSVGRTYGYCGP